MKKAVFLDRDGTINEDPGYLNQASQMKLLPGVAETLASLRRQGYLLIVVSNQSGVGRGLIRLEDIPKIHARLDELLAPVSAKIDHYELCFHRPEENCSCRKPLPELLLRAAEKLDIDLSQSYMVGDKATDLEAGRAAGCKAVFLVGTGDGLRTKKAISMELYDGFAMGLSEILALISQ
ncbi:MAG: HAD family hydrolase [Methylotenera sp.]|nr:HAD family hydrolase [Oligoflexia bacterium]